MVDMPEGGKLAQPGYIHSPLMTFYQSLELELGHIKRLVHGKLLDITLLPSFFSLPHPENARYMEKREFALALCLFSKYFFVCRRGFIDINLIDVVFQAYLKKANIVPIILGETLHGLDHFSLGDEYGFNRGSPLLLHMWLQEHFQGVKPFEGTVYNPIAYGLRSFGSSFHRTAEEWLMFFANVQTDEITWMPPHWRLKRFIVHSTSKTYVFLPGLRHTSFYLGNRITRQFGRAPRVPIWSSSSPTKEVMSMAFATHLSGAWNCRIDDRSIPVGNPPESIFLDEAYLGWLIPQVEREYFGIVTALSKVLGGTIANAAEDRMREARRLHSAPNDHTSPTSPEIDPIDAYLAHEPYGENYRNSGEASSSQNSKKKGKSFRFW
jgi:hypothetical protein